MQTLKLVYTDWISDIPLPNCIRPEIFEYYIENYTPTTSYGEFIHSVENKFGNQSNVFKNDIGLKQIKPTSIKFDKNATDWYYPIEPWGHIMYSVNLDAVHDFYNIFDLIPDYIIDGVNSNKGKIIINYSHEGWVGDFLLKGLYIGIKNIGVKFENVIIILNDYNLETKLESFKERFNIENYPKVINYSFYLTASSNHFYHKYKNTSLKQQHYLKFKPFKFLCLNRRFDKHRVKLLSEIFYDIKNVSIISFDKKLVTNEIDAMLNSNLELKTKFENLPEKSVADRDDIENTNGYRHESELMFVDSYISIVTETSFYNDNDFISEKIWKPIYQFSPFIVIGRPHMLKYLKEIGFKTFDFLIDETYDGIDDNELRMQAIINEIQRLNSLSIYKIDEILKANFSTLEHNHTLMNTIGANSEIEKYLIEKIKDNNYSYLDLFKTLNLNQYDKFI